MRGYRLKQVEQYILENDTVSLEQLCENFGVSINTIRRDIAELLKLGQLEKIYGGVRAQRKSPLLPFDERHSCNMDQKSLIGQAAAQFVRDGDVIYIDSGTTTVKLLEGLRDKHHITVITGNLNAIMEAVPYRNINLITVTGQLDRKTNSFIGLDTMRALDGYNIKKAFMAAAGLSLAGGVTNSSLLEHEVKAKAIQRSSETFLMMDASKFGVTSLTTYAQIGDFDHVITDRTPPAEYLSCFDSSEVELVVCKQ